MIHAFLLVIIIVAVVSVIVVIVNDDVVVTLRWLVVNEVMGFKSMKWKFFVFFFPVFILFIYSILRF